MNRQSISETNANENISQSVMNEIINNLWAVGGAISHDENNDILKVVVDKEIEKDGKKETVQEIHIYPVKPKSSITLLFMASATLGLEKGNRPKDLHQAREALKEANEKYINSLSPEEQQELYEKEFIKVPGHEWITRSETFSKEKESANLNFGQELAQA